MALVTLVPDADDTDGGWTTQAGGSSLFAVVDEASPDDADYIISDNNPVGDTCKIRLSDPGTPMSDPMTVAVRVKKLASTTAVNLTIRLLEGATVRAVWVQTLTDTWTTVTNDLTAGERAAIVDFTNLYVELEATAGSQGSLLVDTYPGASTAYALRRLNSGYSGFAVRLRRASDDQEQNFGFNVLGDVDTDAIATFLTATSGYVVTWYDQSGYGLHVTQADPARQPLYVASGIGSKPSVQFDGVNDALTRANVLLSQIYASTTAVQVVLNVSSVVRNSLFGIQYTGTAYHRIHAHCPTGYGGANTPTFMWDCGDCFGNREQVSVPSPSSFFDQPHIFGVHHDSNGFTGISLDGSILTANIRPATYEDGSGNWCIGHLDLDANYMFKGQIAEFVSWGADVGDDDRYAIYRAQNDYYGLVTILEPPSGLVADLVDNFGGEISGWNVWYTRQTQPVTLTIPAGNFDLYSASLALPSVFEPRACTIQGAGRGITFIRVGAVGTIGTPDRGGGWPRLQDCNAGDMTSTVVEAKREMRTLYPGRWHVICGNDLMGYGYPQDNTQFEYHKLVSYDPATGVCTWDEPLLNSYKEHWPCWWDVGPPVYDGTGNVDPGGSPTIIEMGGRFVSNPTQAGRGGWDQDIVIRDLTIVNSHSAGEWWYGAVRHVHYENVDFLTGSDVGNWAFPPTPTLSKRWTHKNCYLGTSRPSSTQEVEVDKMVEYLEYDGCEVANINGISPSPRTLVLKNSQIGLMVGGGQTTTIDNCTIGSLTIGTWAYGCTPIRMTISNSHIPGAALGSAASRHFIDEGQVMASVADNDWAGIITQPIDDYFSYVQIGAQIGGTYRHTSGAICFQIVDMWRDAGNLYMQTNRVGQSAWEPMPAYYAQYPNGGGAWFHDCPALTVTNSTGAPHISSASHFGDTAPVCSRAFFDVGGPQFGTMTLPLFGKFVSFTVNVIKPYTGVRNPFRERCTNWSGGFIMWPDWTAAQGWVCAVNLRIAGERRITTTTVTGAQSGDWISDPPGDAWFTGAMELNNLDITPDGSYNQTLEGIEDPSVWPRFTVEAIFDQGIDW